MLKPRCQSARIDKVNKPMIRAWVWLSPNHRPAQYQAIGIVDQTKRITHLNKTMDETAGKIAIRAPVANDGNG